MAILKISIPDGILRVIKPTLARHGYTVEQFIESSLWSFADASKPMSKKLRAQLIEGLNSPLLQLDEINWSAKGRRARWGRKPSMTKRSTKRRM